MSTVTLEQVLARVHAPRMPAADELQGMSLGELEARLGSLGVDVTADLAALQSAAAGKRASPAAAVPLQALDAADLEALPLAAVEAHLARAGVDVDRWLSTARRVIATGTATGTDAGAERAGRPGLRPAPRRRWYLPRALAASVTLIMVSGLAFLVTREDRHRAEPPLVAETPFPDMASEAVTVPDRFRPRADETPVDTTARAPEKVTDSSERPAARSPPGRDGVTTPAAQRPAIPAPQREADPARARDVERIQSRHAGPPRENERPLPRATGAPREAYAEPRPSDPAAPMAPPALGRDAPERARAPAPPRPAGLRDPMRQPNEDRAARENAKTLSPALEQHAPQRTPPAARARASDAAAPVAGVGTRPSERRVEPATDRTGAGGMPAAPARELLSSADRPILNGPGVPTAERQVTAGVAVADAIADAISHEQDREALRRLLSSETGPGRARIWMIGNSIHLLEYVRSDTTTVRIERDSAGQLRTTATR